MTRCLLSVGVLLAVTLLGVSSAVVEADVDLLTSKVPAFGYSENSENWTISTGAGLTVTMTRANCDITSLLFHNQELQIPTNGSYVNSGLIWNGDFIIHSRIASFNDVKRTVQVTCEMKGLTQYFFFRANENNIYMGTYHTAEMPLLELRFVALLNVTLINQAPRSCVMWDGIPIESADIVVVGNETRSKYYSGVPFINDHYHGITGPAGGVYTVHPPQAYETSISGPFFRDINLNIRNNRSEITFYMNSDHTRTEPYRYGFHGPYALSFTDGKPPTNYDDSFFQRRDLTGFVKDSERGALVGSIFDPKNVLSGYDVVVYFYNKNAQYWTRAKRSLFSHGFFYSSPLMKPGTYTTIVYRKEFPVANMTLTVTKGAATTGDITISFVDTKPLWRIGDWDGTPDGFLNADKIHDMHPSDLRMAPWKPITFDIGSSKDSEFPMAQFRDINDPITIRFPLSAEQAAVPHTFRVGITTEFWNPRLNITVNDNYHVPIQPVACVESDTVHCFFSRSLTRGVTRANPHIYEYAIPAEALQAGGNKFSITIYSVQVNSATQAFIHPALGFDALELV